MKTIYLLTSAFLLFTACSSDQMTEEPAATKEVRNFADDEWPQKWQLVEMTGNMANTPPQKGQDMAWQEWYVLYKDGSFTKTRERGGEITESKGKYTIKSSDDRKYIELAHDADNDLVGSCVSGKIETLAVTSETSLRGTWLICDGPGLEYQRVEYNGAPDER